MKLFRLFSPLLPASLILLGACFSTSVASAQTGYKLLQTIAVPGDGGGDYISIDEAARRIYVSHSTKVDVIDVDTLAIVGSIPKTLGVHGIAIAPESGRGFISNGQTNNVTVFDLKTLNPISDIAVGKKPDAIIYDPATAQVFAFNGSSDSVSAINAASGKVVGTIELGGGPEFAVADGAGYVYNNLEDKSQVVKINAKTLKVEQRWPTAPCEVPAALAMDRANRRLFIGCRNKLAAVMNADTGKILSTLPIGDHVDATAYDADAKLVFHSNGEGTISVIRQNSPDQYSSLETIKTQPHAKTMAFDTKTKRLFLSTADSGKFVVLVFQK